MGCWQGFYVDLLYRKHYQWFNILFKLPDSGAEILTVLTILYFVSDASNEYIFNHVPGRNNTEEVKRNDDHNEGPSKPFGRPPFREMHIFNYWLTSLFLVFFSLGMRVMERHSYTEKLQKELEKEKLNSELAFLKNQISPHFFFNTLNNIYSLISINAEDSQKAVLRLSKLMRYLLYDSEHGNTKLSNEIDFMNNYIDLMKLRMSDKISLAVSFPEKYTDMNIPPLIFIPFIENAFKHGISYREKSFIDISMTSTEGSVFFRCANSIAKSKEDSESDHSGIGLENVTKRLNLLFQGKHDLTINRTETEFEVKLLINFA
jgi:two-component sensor histidine kinase